MWACRGAVGTVGYEMKWLAAAAAHAKRGVLRAKPKSNQVQCSARKINSVSNVNRVNVE